MIFTYDGIGGPAVLDLSRLLADYLPAKKPIEIFIDVVPAMNESQLEEYLMGQLSQYSKKIIANVLFELAPKKLGGLICAFSGNHRDKREPVEKRAAKKSDSVVEEAACPIVAAEPIEEAIITHGGVSTAGIDPTTMQSKVCPGLFFAGETIDVDGPCGGYNLQIAWSTGAFAGKLVVK